MPDKPLRMAVIGAGRMGGFHARVISESPGAELVAVVDRDEARAREVADRHGAQASSADAGPWSEGLDAAVVATPTEAHVAVAGPLLERGIHCLVEKPLAATPQEATELVEAAGRGGATLQVGHTERFNPAFMALARYDLTPRFVEAERISPCRFRSMDVGVVMDLMIHDIDLVLSLVRSDVVSVDAVGVNIIAATEDMANVRVRFANGCVADFATSRAALKVERRIRIFADQAYVGVDFGAKQGMVIRPTERLLSLRRDAMAKGAFDPSVVGDAAFEEMLDVEQMQINDHDALTQQLAAFLASVGDGHPVVVTGQDGQKAVELADRIVRAIRGTPME